MVPDGPAALAAKSKQKYKNELNMHTKFIHKNLQKLPGILWGYMQDALCHSCNKFDKQSCYATAALHEMSAFGDDVDDDCVPCIANDVHTCQNEKDDPNHIYSPWTLIASITLISDILHAIIAQELRNRHRLAERRVTIGCNLLKGGFWAFVLRVLFMVWLLWFAGVWGFWSLPLFPNSDPKRLLRKCNARRCHKFNKKTASRAEKFAVRVDVLCHGVLHINRIMGDGNCYWRAVAKQTNMSWYKLKKLTTEYMMQNALNEQNEKLCQNIKTLQKKNEWASMLAILGTADFLQREVRVCVRGHIIRCRPQHLHTCAGSQSRHKDRAINLYFENSHYSGVDAADVRRRLNVAKYELSSSLREFWNVPLEVYPKDITISRHEINHTGRKRVRNQQLSHLSCCSSSRVGQMPPQYRPAGQGLPKRRPGEDFTSQVMRVAKAKSAAPAVTTATTLMKAMPKVPPRPPIPPRRIPKEPAYPPPGYEVPQPMTPPKSPMTPPKPPCPRPSWNTPCATVANETTTTPTTSKEPEATGSMTRSTSAAAKPPEPSMKPLIATATVSEDRMPYPRLVRKPRTPPLPRRNMPSAAPTPPIIELPPTVGELSGGECTEDSMNDDGQLAPLEALVDRVANEVSRRVLERFASAPYMVGLPGHAVGDRLKLHTKPHNYYGRWDEADVPTQSQLRTKHGYEHHNSRAAVSATLPCNSTNMISHLTHCSSSILHYLCSGFLGLPLGLLERACYLGLAFFLFFRDAGSSDSVLNKACFGYGFKDSPKIGMCASASGHRQSDEQHQPKNAQQIRYEHEIDKSKNTKMISQKVAATKQPRSAEREQPDASACMAGKLDGSSFAAHGLVSRWVVCVMCLISIISDASYILYARTMQGGMLDQIDEVFADLDEHGQSSTIRNTTSLEECAHNVLIGDCINIDNIRTLLEHPEAPWTSNKDGFQITLGAARLSLTKTSSVFPNFTKVMSAYMQQCNSKAQGSTIVINKNLRTAVHIDSRNEKLPAHLTAMTNYDDGEIFLKSEHGDKFFEGQKGFMVQIPIGCTITVPTFKIPHATNSWKGNRIIMVLFTSPIKRIDASRNNLRSQLERLGFHIPAIDKSWVDCEIVGSAQGNPIYSRPASIRGFFNTGEHRHAASGEQGGMKIEASEHGVCEISSESEPMSNQEQTRTWTDPFDSQISDIEYCPEEALSPATTILDDDSDLQPSDCDDENVADALCRKRKRTSPERRPDRQLQSADAQRRSSCYDREWLGYLGTSSLPQLISEGVDDRNSNRQGYALAWDCDFSRSERTSVDPFGLNITRDATRSIHSDPIEPCTEDETSCFMSGGGAPAGDFTPNKADISKLVQKLKNAEHGYAPKQIRMLLISDAKFFKKIERTTGVKQLQSCVAAAAQRMGLSGALESPKVDATGSAQIPNRQKANAQPLSASDGKANFGKGRLTAAQKGKGKGDSPNTEPKGRGKQRDTQDTNTQKRDVEKSTIKGKSKGKGKGSNITYSIDPDGWNVRPLAEFSSTHGGVYMCEKEEQAKHIAEKGVGRNYPIGVVAPFPMDIGVKQPESICVEFIKHFGDQSHKISMQAFLHQITYVDVEYRKMAPAVSIQKPSIAKSSVCYLTFSDSGACAQTQIEIEQKKIPAVKQWISSLVQLNRNLEILDVWNVQAVQKHVNERIYQVSVRVPSTQVESLLAMSGPGKLQVNVPGALRTNLQHIWLKKEGRPMTEEEVLDIMDNNEGKHLGAFQVRGTWALRMLTEHHNEMKNKLGRNEDPAYFISNVPPEMEVENIQEILQQLKWKATVRDGERRWKRAGYTWLVRSGEDPKVWQFPITFGYERRTLKIEAARKPKINPTPPMPLNSVMHFPTWNAQCRIGKHLPRCLDSQPSFAEVVNNAARKRHRTANAPIQRKDSENWSDFEEDAEKQDSNNLQQQLNEMMKQNSEQQQTIQQLLQQIQSLTTQVQALTAQNLAGGANNANGLASASNPS